VGYPVTVVAGYLCQRDFSDLIELCFGESYEGIATLVPEAVTLSEVSELDEIRKISLAKITCDNCDRVTHIQRAMFDVPDPFLNPRVPCSALPAINLDLWKERVSCNVGGTGIEIGDAKRISPCTMCTCTKEGPVCQSLKIEN
jgi:hypothetical protein